MILVGYSCRCRLATRMQNGIETNRMEQDRDSLTVRSQKQLFTLRLIAYIRKVPFSLYVYIYTFSILKQLGSRYFPRLFGIQRVARPFGIQNRALNRHAMLVQFSIRKKNRTPIVALPANSKSYLPRGKDSLATYNLGK